MKFKIIMPALSLLAMLQLAMASDMTEVKNKPTVGTYYYPWYQPGEPEWGWAGLKSV